MEKAFIVEYENRTIGVWNNFELAKKFIMGCHQNKLMTSNATIKAYDMNSCYNLEIQTIQNKEEPVISLSSSNTEQHKVRLDIKAEDKESYSENKTPKLELKPKIDENNPAMIEMAKQKVELQHKINLLKQQKKKIEESKVSYANDIKLFELFTDSKKRDPNFIIPEIFTKKFELMTKLNSEQKLSWDNFVKEFQQENIYNDYFGLNSYEEMFLESDDEKSNISEELDIESDSSTDTSED
jgi:hypothetical protein